jgi:hypothetical protein
VAAEEGDHLLAAGLPAELSERLQHGQVWLA